jgi:hypothetical protein
MTAQQETLFICDRCREHVTLPLQNGPATMRSMPPENWLTLWRNEVTRAPVHLCPTCAEAFDRLLHP